MARALRIEFPGAIYHVMSRGVNRGETFLDDEDRWLFLERVGKFVAKGVLMAHAFGLLDNHFHLLCETPLAGLGRWMQRILGPYSQAFNARRRRVGTLWQGRYKAILVEDGLYFLNASAYIHRQGPQAGVCATPDDYRWSSWGAFGNGACPVDWVHTERTLRAFQGPEDYRRFVLNGPGAVAPNPFSEATGGVLYGGDLFLRKVLKLVEDRRLDPEIPSLSALREFESRPSAEQIRQLIAEVFANRSECLRRRILVYALSRRTLLTGRRIGVLTGLTPSAVTKARQAIASRLMSDPELAREMEALERGLLDPRLDLELSPLRSHVE